MFRPTSLGICIVVLAAGSLSGCAGFTSIAPEAAGLGAGAGAGVLTANPLIGVAVGLGARLATAEAVGAIEASHQREVQRAIASAAGEAPVGETARWSTKPSTLNGLLYGTISGEVQVAREFGGRIRCREILYTADGEGGVLGLADEAEADLDVTGGPGDGTPAGVRHEGAPAGDRHEGAPAGASEGTPPAEGDSRPQDSVADAAQGANGAEPPAKSDGPMDANVLVAVICRGVSAASWRWAVSEPAG